ncbi:hypothetical protein VKT23_011968 [Stygiomarasmius scandens]
MGVSWFLIFVVLFVVFKLSASFFHQSRSHLPFPPGPKRIPFLGNIANAISRRKAGTHQWAHYLELSRKYQSDVVHIDILGDHIIILNSVKATNEILEKRSGLYSSRPPMHMHRDLVGWHWNFATMPYTSKWRLHRRIFHQDFQSQAIAIYEPIILQSCSDFLKKLVPTDHNLSFEVPDIEHEDLDGYVRNHAGSVILRAVYGMKTREEIDDYVVLVGLAAPSVLETMNHGSFFVDHFPLLKYLPAWLPGTSFKNKAKAWAPTVSNLVNSPWEKFKSAFLSGASSTCVAAKNFEKFNLVAGSTNTSKESDIDIEEIIRNTAGIAYFAGSDTTVSLLMSSLFALSHHPEVQKKAQNELDMAIGHDRLPNFSDRHNLPYIEAILKEAQRMFPVTPLALPHCSVSDDIYEGYFIPKGSVIIGNVWAILHDQETYHDPMHFNPDRFMGEKSTLPPDPELYAFGFGRR